MNHHTNRAEMLSEFSCVLLHCYLRNSEKGIVSYIKIKLQSVKVMFQKLGINVRLQRAKSRNSGVYEVVRKAGMKLLDCSFKRRAHQHSRCYLRISGSEVVLAPPPAPALNMDCPWKWRLEVATWVSKSVWRLPEVIMASSSTCVLWTIP